MFYLGNRSRQRAKGVHPQLVFIAEQTLMVSPIDFGVAKDGGVRTASEQHSFYKKGLTHADGYKILSKHQVRGGSYGHYGRALDVYPIVNGAHSYDPVHVAIVGSSFMTMARKLYIDNAVTIKLRWGLTFGSDEFKGWDGCHFEIVEGGEDGE